MKQAYYPLTHNTLRWADLMTHFSASRYLIHISCWVLSASPSAWLVSPLGSCAQNLWAKFHLHMSLRFPSQSNNIPRTWSGNFLFLPTTKIHLIQLLTFFSCHWIWAMVSRIHETISISLWCLGFLTTLAVKQHKHIPDITLPLMMLPSISVHPTASYIQTAFCLASILSGAVVDCFWSTFRL